jgi:membrane associated rhomboid family serine protease
MDWSLVLASQAIPTRLEADVEGRHWLEVPEADASTAQEVLKVYQAENRRWRWERRIPSTPLVFHWGSVVWVALILALHVVTVRDASLYEAGVMNAVSVRAGEWWRPITAVTLHADSAHLAANAMSGFLFLGIAMGYWGAGLALLAALLAGVAGNFAGWAFYPETTRIVGASGMIMGAIGLLAVAPTPVGSLTKLRFQVLLRALTPAAFLFVLLGFGPRPHTDLIGHTAGFVAGMVFGLLLHPLRRRPQIRARLNQPAMIVAMALFAAAWIALVRR